MSLICKRIATGLCLVLLLASSASAIVLWDQGTIVPAGPGITNSRSPGGIGGFIMHSVNDVTVAAPGWHVTKITQFYSGFNPNWTGITLGYVNVQPKTGALPTANPVAVTSPMSCVADAARSAALGQTVFAVSANVNINLPAGDHWIGITPQFNNSPLGINLQWPAALVGDPVATFNVNTVGPWMNNYPGWDGTLILEGDITVSVEEKAWGSVKALFQ